ncbi:MAG TPA: TetR/AcrR family transcriptional regulator [Chthoniobacter sp.]|jgi:TetR/AcrR family transcriptional repressor of nem operon
MPRSPKSTSPTTRRKLLDAGVELIRARGYHGTTVDDICHMAGVTKGGFFHYFESKDDIASAALAAFVDARSEIFRNAPFRNLADPLERVFGRLDFEKELIESSGKTKGCLAGTLAQELALSRKEFRAACHDFFVRRADDFAADLAAAKAACAPGASFDPQSVANFYLAVTQGSQILSKASGNNEVRLANLEHFRAYLRSLFGVEGRRPQKGKAVAAGTA